MLRKIKETIDDFIGGSSDEYQFRDDYEYVFHKGFIDNDNRETQYFKDLNKYLKDGWVPLQDVKFVQGLWFEFKGDIQKFSQDPVMMGLWAIQLLCRKKERKK